jgi:hypothetical protein
VSVRAEISDSDWRQKEVSTTAALLVFQTSQNFAEAPEEPEEIWGQHHVRLGVNFLRKRGKLSSATVEEPAIKKKTNQPSDGDRGDDDEGKFHGHRKLARETGGLLLRGSEIAVVLLFMVRGHINCPASALAQPIK